MRIALIAPPFIPVPPARYGGTELFIADLAEALTDLGHEVVVYANGESTVRCEVRYLYPRMEWPMQDSTNAAMKDLHHTAWACHEACDEFDLVHVSSAPGVVFSRFCRVPFLATLHHPYQESLSALYAEYPEVQYVAISDFQRDQERMERIRTIHHGIDMERYRFVSSKQPYVSFVGRITAVKGPHLAIQAARKAGVAIKLGGEIQPNSLQYWESMVKPYVDGRQVEYVGEVDVAAKNELLAHSMAMLFPVQWNEPFGLAMVEAMACGTPVLAFRGGSPPEVIEDGTSGWVCRDVDDMAQRLRAMDFAPEKVREYCRARFERHRMARDYAELYQEHVAEFGRSSSLRRVWSGASVQPAQAVARGAGLETEEAPSRGKQPQGFLK